MEGKGKDSHILYLIIGFLLAVIVFTAGGKLREISPFGIAKIEFPTETPLLTLQSTAPLASNQPTSQPGSIGSIPPTLTPLSWSIETAFTVQANQPWQNTNVEVRQGDFLEIVYISGEWTGRSSSPGLSGPDFGPSPENTDECYPIRGEGSSLIGKIGNGQPFKVGYQYVGNPTDAGFLFLRMNDCDKLLFDNAGSITVAIRIRR